jgi:hypothetical protein
MAYPRHSDVANVRTCRGERASLRVALCDSTCERAAHLTPPDCGLHDSASPDPARLVPTPLSTDRPGSPRPTRPVLPLVSLGHTWGTGGRSSSPNGSTTANQPRACGTRYGADSRLGQFFPSRSHSGPAATCWPPAATAPPSPWDGHQKASSSSGTSCRTGRWSP